MDKWVELRKAIEELSGEFGKALVRNDTDKVRHYAFCKALQWVLGRMSYLDEQEKGK